MEEKTMKAPHLLISFVMDNSACVAGERLGEMMGAFRAFAARTDLACVPEWELLTFDAFAPTVVKGFEDKEIAPVSARRFPLLGRAVRCAADRLMTRVKTLKEAGEEVYRPWMFILSGGFTADAMETATAMLDRLEKGGELLYLPFKLTEALKTERLQCLDRHKHMIEIKVGQIGGLFTFIENMIGQRAALAPDVSVKFSKNDFEGWAVL